MSSFWFRITYPLWGRFYEKGVMDGIKAARRLPENYLVMSRELLEDYKRQAARDERNRLRGQG